MIKEVALNDTLPIAVGAGILGTGGGGNTYLGRLRLEQALKQTGKACRIIRAEDVPDDGLVCSIGGMGAPTVSIEKIQRGDELSSAVRALSEHLRKPFYALVIGEIGGSNALGPLISGLQLDLPVIDGDGMGRAFPELQMDTFSINGISLSPMALGDVHGNTAIFEHVISPKRAEALARSLTIEMGGAAALAMHVMTGVQVRQTIIRGTLSLAQRIGHLVLDCRRRTVQPAQHIAEMCNGRVLFEGKIVDVERRTVTGFARGKLKLAAFGDADDTMEIVFQNENLVAWHNGEIVCTVPDLISIINLEDGEPVSTELVRYGLRVAVLGMPAPRELKTAAALEVVGPRAFGYNVDFQALPGDLLL